MTAIDRQTELFLQRVALTAAEREKIVKEHITRAVYERLTATPSRNS